MPHRLAAVVALTLVSSAAAADRPPTFERDVEPLLARYGCNSGPCHGKARGQNGFALSLLGFDADFDYAAIVEEARGRRLFPADPDASLFLLKASGEVPHGGGRRWPKGAAEYALVRRWVASGTPRTPKDAPALARITVTPGERRMRFGESVQLTVTVHLTDGTTEDVTKLAAFQSNDAGYAAVDANGRVTAGPVAGEAAITARFRDKFAVCSVLIPLPGAVDPKEYDALPRRNFIDGHVWAKLQRLGLTASPTAPDATFHRRAYLDVIGRLPTPDETRAFLTDTDANKREKLIDRLLARPEYADYWANKWADLLRPNPYRVGIKAVFNLDAWLRDQFRRNVPYDRFVRELLTAQGSTFRNGAAVLFRDRREPEELTTIVSQLFLGVRLECAKCHQHPSERWSQRDFYSFAAFFGRLGHKGTGLSPPISGGEEVIVLNDPGAAGGGRRKRGGGPVKHPLTGEEMVPTPLLGQPLDVPAETDPRAALAEWMTAPDNPFFARVIVNRVWADLMGRGLVEPVDDLRDTNPPTNGPLLDALAADFRAGGYDLKKLIRRITTSAVYGLSSLPTDRNVSDTRNYSRHYRVRLRAEVLLDAVSDVTGVPERFDAMPPGSRAVEAWTVRFDSKFLDSFGRPDPNQDPPCERTTDTTVVQALHLMNAPNVARKITADDGRAVKLAASKRPAAEIVDELYLLVYGRPPTAEERAACVARFERPGAKRREATEDLLWALLNTPEFVFRD
jgi:hypothetical protein